MEKYLVPLSPSSKNPKPRLRPRWKRTLIELDGRCGSRYRHDIAALLMKSYSQIAAFPHTYHTSDGIPCLTHMCVIASDFTTHVANRVGISMMDFDSKGIYLASVTKSGCLTVHDFEVLYSQSNRTWPSLHDDEEKHLLHLSMHQQLDVVRWNVANQDEVACASNRRDGLKIFDVGYASSKPVQVLKRRNSVTIHGRVCEGFSDIAFTSKDESRLLASDLYGIIDVWDRRMSDLPCLELRSSSGRALNSIQLLEENQVIFGAGKCGTIYLWDLRGGRTATAFQSHQEVYQHPLASLKLTSLLGKIEHLKAQSDITTKEIQAISINPSCPYQLAFHLDDGWSGVLDIHSFEVTHLHCPPPAWLNGSSVSADLSYVRKPSWLPNSIFVIGSSSNTGMYLLDFYPDSGSPCHVDYNEDRETYGVKNQQRQNRFVPLTEGVTTVATHPLNGTVVAGTKKPSLLVISQKHQSSRGTDEE